VRVCGGILCRTKRAEVMMPSQPSFCTPGRPDRNLSVTSLPSPSLRKPRPGTARISASPYGLPLLRNRSAVWLFALSLVTIVANNAYDVAAGTSLMLVDSGWQAVTLVIVLIALMQVAYAWMTMKRGALI